MSNLQAPPRPEQLPAPAPPADAAITPPQPLPPGAELPKPQFAPPTTAPAGAPVATPAPGAPPPAPPPCPAPPDAAPPAAALTADPAAAPGAPPTMPGTVPSTTATTEQPLAEFVLPSLPSNIAAAMPPVDKSADTPKTHQPSQVGAGSAAAWIQANSATAAKPRQVKTAAPGRRLMLTLTLAVLALVAGAGARYGYDWYQTRDDMAATAVAMPADGDLAGWPTVDPPAIRFADTVTTVTGETATDQITAHRDLVRGSKIIGFLTASDTGVERSAEIDIRGDDAFIKPSSDDLWSAVSIGEARAAFGDRFVPGVFTISDIFPAEALPHTTVLENVERQLTLARIEEAPVAPLDSASNAAGASENPLAAGVATPTTVRHYRVIIDEESFRVADGAAFETWERQLGAVAGPRLDVWVDAQGVVRQVVFDDDGVIVSHTLVSGSSTSRRFDSNPLLDNAATNAALFDEAAPPAAGE